MGEQLDLTVQSKCDNCHELKPRALVDLADKSWFCDECLIKSDNLEVIYAWAAKTVRLSLEKIEKEEKNED